MAAQIVAQFHIKPREVESCKAGLNLSFLHSCDTLPRGTSTLPVVFGRLSIAQQILLRDTVVP